MKEERFLYVNRSRKRNPWESYWNYKFWSFVDLGDRKTGLVHISEVSRFIYQDIKEVLKVGDEVKVKVMTIADDGKISLSIRRAVDKPKEDTSDKPKTKTFTPRNRLSRFQEKSLCWQNFSFHMKRNLLRKQKQLILIL